MYTSHNESVLIRSAVRLNSGEIASFASSSQIDYVNQQVIDDAIFQQRVTTRHQSRHLSDIPGKMVPISGQNRATGNRMGEIAKRFEP